MEIDKIVSLLVFIIASLLVGGVLKYFSKRSHFPYTVGLFSFGLLAGLLARYGVLDSLAVFERSVEQVSNANPEVILYLFLPILIFDAAYELDAHIFKKNLANATLLAAPGMVISMFLTGALMIFLHTQFPSYAGWTWQYALMFGALISATDPVAVVALLHDLSVSKRFSTLVDAESLLNDGTGIVLFMIFFGQYTTNASTYSPVVSFFVVVAGGILLGCTMAFLCLTFILKVHGDRMVQSSIIIVSAYLVFLLAQSYMNVSGVIALVCYGLGISYFGKLYLEREVNEFMKEFWQLASHLGNTLIFIIVGIVIALKTNFTLSNFVLLACLYVGINLIRMLMILILYPAIKRMGYGMTLSESFILSWGGLRGALALTLALMTSYVVGIPEEVRHQILFQTAGIVTLTLTINATSIGWFLKKLGFREQSKADQLLKQTFNNQVLEESQSYLSELMEKKAFKGTNWNLVSKFLPPAVTAELPKVTTDDLEAKLRIHLIRLEKLQYWELYNERVISSITLKKWLAIADDIHDSDGKIKLSTQSEMFSKLCKPTQ
ncbi:MAG: sodium:proton antiporter, partial [Bacteroidaceae bacterium]|nr:sodium:proton antiporter [Bacteroidaceae bacterium]